MTITTKYNIHDIVWFMKENTVRYDVVQQIRTLTIERTFTRDTPETHTETSYGLRGERYFKEYEVFPSKEELLKSL